MFKRPHYIALGIVLVVTLVVLKLPSRTAAQLKLAISGLFLPLFGFASSSQEAVEKAGQTLVPRKTLLKQIADLEQENRGLRVHAAQWEAAAQENARLRHYFGWAKQQPWKLKLVRVVGRDPANWWHTLRIDAGSRDGIATNAAVLTPEGLVGRVSQVGFAQSQVVLVGDPDCRVAVQLEDTRDQGVIVPMSASPLDPMLVDLGYLPRTSQLRPGQKVVTSGSGGIFPQGIPVGQLVDFRSVGYGLYNEARVRLQVRMNALEEVFVKMP